MLRSDILFASKATTFSVEDLTDGTVTEVLVPAGRHRASYWWDLLPQAHKVTLGDGLSIFPARSGYTVIAPVGRYKSDANPDFVPKGQAEKLADALRLQLARLSATNKANDARVAAAKRLAAIPPAPAAPVAPAAGDSVVE